VTVGQRWLPVRSPKARSQVARWLTGKGSRPAAPESYDATTALRRDYAVGIIAGWRHA
jgi:hypothetical protein